MNLCISKQTLTLFLNSIDTTTQLQDTTKSIHVEIVSKKDITTSSAEENVNKTVKKNGPAIKDEVTIIPILYGVLISVSLFCIACIIYRKGKICILITL